MRVAGSPESKQKAKTKIVRVQGGSGGKNDDERVIPPCDGDTLCSLVDRSEKARSFAAKKPDLLTWALGDSKEAAGNREGIRSMSDFVMAAQEIGVVATVTKLDDLDEDDPDPSLFGYALDRLIQGLRTGQ